jgi:hypothetical protein
MHATVVRIVAETSVAVKEKKKKKKDAAQQCRDMPVWRRLTPRRSPPVADVCTMAVNAVGGRSFIRLWPPPSHTVGGDQSMVVAGFFICIFFFAFFLAFFFFTQKMYCARHLSDALAHFEKRSQCIT